jgi:hypothetical protein
MFGSGVGTGRATLPAGVAIKVAAGQQVILNLHLFNTSDAQLVGTSGIRVKTADPAAVPNIAEGQLMGPVVQLDIPPSSNDVRVSGECTISGEPIHVVSIAPHMHVLGVHLKTELVRDGVATTLFDVDYSFDNQVATPMDPIIDVAPGDKIRTTCTYDNPTDHEVVFGESSTDEMCMSGLLYYPAQNKKPFCDDMIQF